MNFQGLKYDLEKTDSINNWSVGGFLNGSYKQVKYIF